MILVTPTLLGVLLLGGCDDDDSTGRQQTNISAKEAAQAVVTELKPTPGAGQPGLKCTVPGFGEEIEAWIVECETWNDASPDAERQYSLWHVNDETGEVTRVIPPEAD